MFWLVAWIVLTLIGWPVIASDRERDGKPQRHGVIDLAASAVSAVVIVVILAVLLGNPGLWNALSLGQR